MEWLIPIQTFQVENAQLGAITHTLKPLLPLSYRDSEQHFPSLSLLLPSLKIKAFDPSTGHFVISLTDSPSTMAKLQGLQDRLISFISLNYPSWFPTANPPKKPSDIRAGFQPLVQGTELHLYCPTQSHIAQTVPFYTNGSWSKNGLQTSLLHVGSKVRIAFRIQGISFHIHPSTGKWSGKFRLQHKLLAILNTL